MGWKKVKIEEWLHFVSILEKTGGVYTYKPMWSFRGQADSSWTLRPTLTRKLKSKKTVNLENAKNLEQQLLAEFSTGFPAISQSSPKDYVTYQRLRWLTFLQHYGGPTRLLDWSDSPFVAMYFACENEFKKDGVVFCFADSIFLAEQRKNNNHVKLKSEEELLWSAQTSEVYQITTNFQNIRCLSQMGTFTFSTSPFDDHDDLIPKVFINVTEPERFCTKLIIPASLKLEFLSRLSVMGISSATLFPGEEGFGRSFNIAADLILETEKLINSHGASRMVDDSMFKGGKRTHDMEKKST